MELEEAIKRCKHIVQNFNDMRKYELPPHKFTISSEDSDCIEIILQTLEKEKYFNKIHGYHMKYNFIPKKVIQEKLDKLKKEYKEELEKDSIKAFILKCQIEILQELLEKPNERFR